MRAALCMRRPRRVPQGFPLLQRGRISGTVEKRETRENVSAGGKKRVMGGRAPETCSRPCRDKPAFPFPPKLPTPITAPPSIWTLRVRSATDVDSVPAVVMVSVRLGYAPAKFGLRELTVDMIGGMR
ncbi:hypothetical protein MRX96_059040 [Rhipicephalus microplus]